jgi:hypothetical protein
LTIPETELTGELQKKSADDETEAEQTVILHGWLARFAAAERIAADQISGRQSYI